MGKNNKNSSKNKQDKMQNNKNNREVNFDIRLDNNEKMSSDEELKRSIETYEVPKLDIPDLSKVDIEDNKYQKEKSDLLDRFMSIDDKDFDKKKKNKNKNKDKNKDREKNNDRQEEKSDDVESLETEVNCSEESVKETEDSKNKEASDSNEKNHKEEAVTFKEVGKEEKRSEKKSENIEKDNSDKVKKEDDEIDVPKELLKDSKSKEASDKRVVNENINNVNNMNNVKRESHKKIVKRLNVKNLFKLIIKLIIFIVVICLVAKAATTLFNSRDIKVSEVLPGDIAISDYTEAPLTNYAIYKTIPTVKGVYLSEYTMASSSNVDKWIEICKQKEINAVVINVKNDDGLISFEIDYDVAHEIGADDNRTIKDPAELTLKLKQAGIFPIARIVAFKDPYLAKNRPDLAIKDSAGNVLRIKSGNNWEAWVNPYNKELWDYVVGVSKCAADMGFKEIQYDYIRFATGSQLSSADFGFESDTKTFRDIVLEFSRYAKTELEAYGVYLSADVFGTIITSDLDASLVGQNYLEMAKIYDYICPMIYPSHYNNGSMGITYPDLDPYNLVLKALEASNEMLDEIPEGEHRAIVRAWLQDFTAPWVKPHQTYGPQQLREQKNAVYDSNNTEWLLWNAGNKYSVDGLDANSGS